MRSSKLNTKILLLLTQIVIALWIIGFIVFIRIIKDDYNSEVPKKYFDCMIVFTGGKGRIEQAIEILESRHIPKLLISGVWDGTSMQDIKKINDIQSNSKIKNQTYLGRFATTTKLNAVETDMWMMFENCNNALIITSDYHLPRSKYLASKLITGPHITFHGINSSNFKINQWWDFPGTFKLVFIEYNKYILTVIMDYLGFLELI